jgi:hypothetical protein
MTPLEKQLGAALRVLFDCEALEMYRRDDNPAWDSEEIRQARAALVAFDALRATERAPSADLQPCCSPYCECAKGACTHPGFYDARGTK